eukprot:scaffold200996_cov21-Prasinocladus_malaysianus.AAC.1
MSTNKSKTVCSDVDIIVYLGNAAAPSGTIFGLLLAVFITECKCVWHRATTHVRCLGTEMASCCCPSRHNVWVVACGVYYGMQVSFDASTRRAKMCPKV